MSIHNIIIGLLPGLVLLATGTGAAQTDDRSFPYNALVFEESVKVYSGPGSVHYATDELTRNATVDVYRHDPGGWCAIRPPSSSFSLVPATAIDRIADDVGQVREDGVQAWVGTRFGSVERPLWQVKLKQGEQVRIVGEVSWPGDDGESTDWYQIAPPAGEFRWIRISDLKMPASDEQLPEEDPRQTIDFLASLIPGNLSNDQIGDRGAVAVAGFQVKDQPGGESKLSPPSEKDQTVNQGWKRARRSLRTADRRDGADYGEPFKTPVFDGTNWPADASRLSADRNDSRSDNRTDWNSGAATNFPSRFAESVLPIAGPVSDRIRQLENELTTEMLKAPAEWQLESILRRATAITTTAVDPLEREHANRLIVKIRNCTNIQSDYENSFGRPESASLLVDNPVGTGVGVDAQVQFGTTYDAYGWLNELIRDKGKLSPTYVLEDDEGKIICHVAPAPGLNLKRYLKNKVGVIGRRGFHRDLQLNHVTAERVVVLDKVRR